MEYTYPAATADKDEGDASSGASSRAPSTPKQSMMKGATPTMSRRHMSSCMVSYVMYQQGAITHWAPAKLPTASVQAGILQRGCPFCLDAMITLSGVTQE